MATEPLIPDAPPRLWHRRWRLLLCICALGVATVAGLVGWQMIRLQRARAELQQVIAELDRDEPGWRIEAIEAARERVPDEENNVPVIIRARRAIPRLRNEDHDELRAMLAGLSPNVRLTDDEYTYCINHLELMERTISLVGQVARMPRGYCPIQHSADGFRTNLVLINEARWLQFWPTHLLLLVSAQEGNAETGLQMCAVNLHIAAAIGDEPFLVCQWYRTRHADTAVDGFERLLAQLEIGEADLAAFQAKLSAEAAHDPWPVGLRGDRAGSHQTFDAFARGILPVSRWREMRRSSVRVSTWRDRVKDWFDDRFPVAVEANEADTWYLRRETKLLCDTANVPWHERAAAVAAFIADEASAPEFEDNKSRMQQLFVPLQYGVARLRCAVAAAAVERYRLRHGRWPDSLDDTIPDFLPSIAADPFDGRPLRYIHFADGVAVYAVGWDLVDNDGRFTREYPPPDGTDIGFRLWDVASRGQAPPKTPEAAP